MRPVLPASLRAGGGAGRSRDAISAETLEGQEEATVQSSCCFRLKLHPILRGP